MILVQLIDIQFSLLNKIEVGHYNSSHGTHNARVTRKERQKACRILDDIPWSAGYTKDRDQDGSSEYVDVFRTKAAYIVTERIGASGDLVTDCSEHKRGRHEKLRCSAIEVLNHSRHIPLKFSPDHLVCGGHEYWCQCTQRT